MHWDKEPSLIDFMNKLNACVKDTGVMINDKGYIFSHNIVGGIQVMCENEDDESVSYEVTGLELDFMSCGCVHGISIVIKKVQE
jgi:hypothetical protein